MQARSEGWIREAPPAIDSKPVADSRSVADNKAVVDPKPVVEPNAVLQQLDRMLKSRHFRNSRRYPAFLAHIVRRTLERDFDSLKERILGIEVFKRAHDYDTAADPVVRITAGEVRKRIALYYHDEGTGQELRIELPPGSYLPVFSAPANSSAGPDAVAWHAPIHTEAAALDAIAEKPRLGWKWILAGSILGALPIVAAAIYFWTWTTSPIESMWRPFLGSPDPVLIVVGSPLGRLAGAASAPGLPLDSHSHVHMSFNDALALTDITGLLEIHRQPYRVQTSATTSLDDLRKRPVVLITAFGNAWSSRILSSLRFSLLRQQIAPDGSTMLGSIVDRRHPGSMWNFDFTKPASVNSKDYAIVARLRSDLTEGPVMVVAGLGAGGTESAGEFVASAEYLQQIDAAGPANWRDRNFELVLEVPMVDGKSGHAHIVASEFW